MEPSNQRPMKCREVSFFVDDAHREVALEALTRDVLPKFLQLPNFRGYVALLAVHQVRHEIIVLSLWDDDLEASEDASKAFVGAVLGAAGTNPIRRNFDILGAMVRTEDRFGRGPGKPT